MITVAVFVIGGAALLTAIKRWHPHTYRCRVHNCGRVFDTRDGRALHFRRAHLS